MFTSCTIFLRIRESENRESSREIENHRVNTLILLHQGSHYV